MTIWPLVCYISTVAPESGKQKSVEPFRFHIFWALEGPSRHGYDRYSTLDDIMQAVNAGHTRYNAERSASVVARLKIFQILEYRQRENTFAIFTGRIVPANANIQKKWLFLQSRESGDILFA